MTLKNWNKWEVVLGSVSREECALLNLPYALHIDRQYMSDIGCVCRVNLCGWTVTVYRPINGEANEPDEDQSTTADFEGS